MGGEGFSNRTGLTPQMRGALTSQSDHKAYIQQAYDDVVVAGGGRLWLPPIAGDWKLGSGLTLHKNAKLGQNVQVLGVGDTTRVQYSPTTGDVFRVGDGASDVQNVAIRDLYLISTATKISGIDFNIRRAANVKLENIKTDGSFSCVNMERVNYVGLSVGSKATLSFLAAWSCVSMRTRPRNVATRSISSSSISKAVIRVSTAS